VFLEQSILSLTPYRLTNAAPNATAPTTAAFKYPALEAAPFVPTREGEDVELAVGVGVTRSVELAVVTPEPVPVEIGAVTMTDGWEMKVVFETANADGGTLENDVAVTSEEDLPPLRKRAKREKRIWNLASILKVVELKRM
jgi:hypothetical protein